MSVGCNLCPRGCGVDRAQQAGFCGVFGASDTVKAAKAMLHFGEEPPISGTDCTGCTDSSGFGAAESAGSAVDGGSGAVFFSGCTMRCVFCQNYDVSSKSCGKEITVRRLADIFLELQEQGAHNINLVTGSHYVPQIIKALDLAKPRLQIPVVFNCGGYEKVETLQMLDGYIDVYLPDIKYYSDDLAARYSSAGNYFQTAYKALQEMLRQTGKYRMENDLIKKGVIVRHLILPGCYKDSIALLNALAPFKDDILISLMSQYVPCGKAADYPEINRRLTTFEYRRVLSECEKIGFEGFTQERSSATTELTPDFDFSGL